jgi:hypothetical protein
MNLSPAATTWEAKQIAQQIRRNDHISDDYPSALIDPDLQ